MQSFQLILVLFSIRFFEKTENNNDRGSPIGISFSIADFSEIVKYISGFFEKCGIKRIPPTVLFL